MAGPKNPRTRGAQDGVKNYKARIGAFEWGGCIPIWNPGQLPVNRPRIIINGRLENGGIKARMGQKKLSTTAIHAADAKVRGLYDFQIGTKKSLILTSVGCADLSATVGFSVSIIDFEQSPVFQAAIYYSAGTVGVVPGVYGDDLYFGQDATLRKYQAVDPPYGAGALAQSGVSQDIPVLTLPAGFTSIPALQEFDGLLFVAAAQGVGTSRVISWDGRTSRDDVTGINVPTGFGLYRESLIMGYNGAPNRIDVRAKGASPGTWTNFAPGAGTAAFLRGVSYRDVFYFTTGGEDLFSFDGAVVTRIPIGTTGIAAGSVTYGIAVFNSLLYVAYAGGGQGRLLSYNGAAWTPIHKNMTTQFAGVSALRDLVAYRGNLVVSGIQSGSGQIFSSPGTGTTGTWVSTVPSSASMGGINRLAVF